MIYFYNDGMGLRGSGYYTYPPEWGAVRDLQDNPEELTNVYDDPAYAQIREDLKAALWREQARLGDAPHPSQPRPPASTTSRPLPWHPRPWRPGSRWGWWG